MNLTYPDTAEKRRNGMAIFRSQMLAQHERMLVSGKLTTKDAEYTKSIIAKIKSTQQRFGE